MRKTDLGWPRPSQGPCSGAPLPAGVSPKVIYPQGIFFTASGLLLKSLREAPHLSPTLGWQMPPQPDFLQRWECCFLLGRTPAEASSQELRTPEPCLLQDKSAPEEPGGPAGTEGRKDSNSQTRGHRGTQGHTSWPSTPYPLPRIRRWHTDLPVLSK